jgi:chaperonin GroEL (HSP60 family)
MNTNQHDINNTNVEIDSMKADEEVLFKKEPRLNVISKETYEERSRKVFNLLWKTLAKSFGPYGAPTLIFNYPYSHVTKDGFTIMKNLSMDASDQLVDQSIANMASDICGRLNYAVGDGTTSAVIATNSIYQNYLKYKTQLENDLIMPRDIIQAFNDVKDDIIEKLHSYVESIQSNDPEKLYENIYKVVYISSNADTAMSSDIASLYRELGFPGINCELSADGIARCRLITGYHYDLVLNDRLYINSDDNTMKVSGADVVIFSVKITKDIYKNILVPLNEHCRMRGRKLIVCASMFDETALGQTIRRDLNNEYQKNKDINMVLCTYKAISEHTRKLIEDFAMLTNTIVIDRELKASIEQQLEKGANILEIFNMDHRNDIPNLVCVGENTTNGSATRFINSDKPEYIKEFSESENAIRLGYVGKASIGLTKSIFEEFYYNQNRYEAVVKEAELLLKEAEDKYKKLGTFNVVVAQAQQRLYSLKLNMGLIEVGADSDLSQKLMKDSADDAIKAAASAFDHGVIKGCNTDMIRSIIDIKKIYENLNWRDETKRMLYLTVMDILLDGFKDVYRTVLSNAFSDRVLITDANSIDNRVYPFVENALIDIFHKNIFNSVVFDDKENVITTIIESEISEKRECKLHDLLIRISAETGMVFDVSTKEFSNNIINSTQTDEEILIATIDLMSLLITGNQMIVTQKHNF